MSVWRSTGPLVVGHRGGRGPGWPPENTLEAFEHARLAGATAIELDVRTSADGQSVVMHDPDLARMTGGRDVRRVADVSAGGLGAVDLGAGARVPALLDVLAWARARGVAVNVELKHDAPRRIDVARAAARAVRASGADVLVSSFDPRLLAMAAVLVPATARALLAHAGQPRWATPLQAALRPPLVRAIHLERTRIGALASCKRRGLRVGVWTVDSPEEAVDLVGRGADWIITDAPGAVRGAIEAARGAR